MKGDCWSGELSEVTAVVQVTDDGGAMPCSGGHRRGSVSRREGTGGQHILRPLQGLCVQQALEYEHLKPKGEGGRSPSLGSFGRYIAEIAKEGGLPARNTARGLALRTGGSPETLQCLRGKCKRKSGESSGHSSRSPGCPSWPHPPPPKGDCPLHDALFFSLSLLSSLLCGPADHQSADEVPRGKTRACLISDSPGPGTPSKCSFDGLWVPKSLEAQTRAR